MSTGIGAPFGQCVTFLNTYSLEATSEFYGRIVGLPLVYEQPGFVLFYKVSPSAYLGICLRAAGSREAGDFKGAIPTLVCGKTAEVDSWQDKLEKAGVAIEKPAGSGVSSDGKHIPTLYNLFVRDPGGYLVEFQVFLDPAWPPIQCPLLGVEGAELVGMSACAIVARLRAGELSPMQCIDAFAAQHARCDTAVNAVPILCLERARAATRVLASRPPPSPLPPGYLHGLPVVVKDLSAVAGVPFVRGSQIHADDIAEESSALVLALEAKGAIVVGKSNVPEYGAGSQTFNPVFGATLNPFDVRRSAGGSSGGAAAALASGTAWLATGSDLGGSLRVPAAFCGVYGFRVTPGRVLRETATASGPFVSLHSIDGPMARSVADLALFLDAMVDFSTPRQLGWDFDAPFDLPAGASCYSDCCSGCGISASSLMPQRVAWSADLNGLLAGMLDGETADMCRTAACWFGSGGGGGGAAVVAEACCPDLSDSKMIFNLLRGDRFASDRADDYANHKDLLKPEVIWNIEVGHSVQAQGGAIEGARAAHQALFERVEKFFEEHDMLITPCAPFPAFDVNVRYPSRAHGVQFGNYLDWMAMSWAITVMQCPVIAIPIGLTKAGLPVGLQLVGKPFSEPMLLAAVAAFEAAHPQAAALVPVAGGPRRLQGQLEPSIDGPRSVAEARTLAHAETASFATLTKPADAAFFSPFESSLR